jgi:glycosyltransferase involved in cell wall biosynthesis
MNAIKATINILFICNEFPPVRHGGIGIFVKTIAKALQQEGARVSILGYNPDIQQDEIHQIDGVSVHWIRKRIAWVPGAIVQHIYDRYYLTKRMRTLERELRPDIVESFDWSGPLLWKPKYATLVVRMHGANSVHAYSNQRRISKFLFFFEKLQLLLADNLCAVSHHIGKATSSCFSINRPYSVIHNPVDCEKFSPQAGSSRAEDVLLYVGRIHPKKGLTELMDVFNLVHAIAPQLKLRVVGEGSPEYIEELKSILTESALKNVFFNGVVEHDQLPYIYNQATVTVMPSKVEAFGLTIIESMACGVAPIISDRTSGNELIADNESGWIINIDQPAEFQNRILHVFANPEQRARFGRNARERAVAFFSLDNIVTQNVMYYSDILNKRV